MADLRLKNVYKRYGEVETIHGIDLDITNGEFVVFVGPSGCGKSTLLRMIAGLEEVSNGDIYIDDVLVNNKQPSERGIAMVFQSYALYPHMTVRENMSFGLEVAKKPKAHIEERVNEAARILKLQDLLDRKPKQLSGGQRQRVAIGRTIVREPQVFLFDEPLSNLDAELRVQMRIEIAKLHESLGNTMIYVTHDQVEAMTMADKIVVLRDGNVEQVGSPLTLYNQPDNIFVAGFIGSPKMNFIPVTINKSDESSTTVELATGEVITLPITTNKKMLGLDVILGIRPEHFGEEGEKEVDISLKVDVVENLGGTSYVYGSHSDTQLIIQCGENFTFDKGRPLKFSFDTNRCHLFDSDGQSLRN
ncbi:sn-glycerol-3-phosphate ABC transporter ATP-binding protein UgpC [Vibrio sp. TH_r3]|uniref:ABC transporter ATP-binding protein n=1 Tax=Vibrio sp. TH_r3 TaxID=3082084 RepID=UPI002954F684|nr:sn-glycerol-3-phosphate ABC transporter ATP-binding protein UgpC [Vibrio sp. TH_r3]MDV7105597.1 sn-glycerol-3-phosphate ABC transporter ATP-binding protein UgpC [Vibrio sp. TH_r3]